MAATVKQDRAVVIVLLLLIGAGYAVTFDFERVALYPRLLLGLMALLAIIIGARTFLPGHEIPSGADEAPLTPAHLAQPAALAVLVVAYAWAIPVLGYFTATLVAMPVFVLFMGVHGLLAPLLCAAGFAAFVYLLFRLQLRVPLPTGLWF